MSYIFRHKKKWKRPISANANNLSWFALQMPFAPKKAPPLFWVLKVDFFVYPIAICQRCDWSYPQMFTSGWRDRKYEYTRQRWGNTFPYCKGALLSGHGFLNVRVPLRAKFTVGGSPPTPRSDRVSIGVEHLYLAEDENTARTPLTCFAIK